MKLTRHNGRTGKNGAYNPKHNDRRFDVEHSEHIDPVRARKNIYWDCYQGFSSEILGEGKQKYSFEDVERMYYFEHYADHVQAQNERNEKARHKERNRTVDDLLKNSKTCPEESIYQIGTIEETISWEILVQIATDFFAEMEQRYGKHFHILDWALHMDEGTPHIHERHVFDCENRYGELCPQQEKALENLGVLLPHPDKPKGKNNNRKQTFDKNCRELLLEIGQRYGLFLEKVPTYGGRDYLEKQDYILEKQKEKLSETRQKIADSEQRIAQQEQQIEEKEQVLEELSLKIEDVESLVSEVAEKAYGKACVVVTDTVREQTREADITYIEGYTKWLDSPERKADVKLREFTIKHLKTITNTLEGMTEIIINKVSKVLQESEKKIGNVEQIKQIARVSIQDKLKEKKVEIDRREAEKKKADLSIRTKQHRELE